MNPLLIYFLLTYTILLKLLTSNMKCKYALSENSTRTYGLRKAHSSHIVIMPYYLLVLNSLRSYIQKPFQKVQIILPNINSLSLYYLFCNCAPMFNMQDASLELQLAVYLFWVSEPSAKIYVSVHEQKHHGLFVDLCFLGRYVRWKLANCNCTLECLVKLFWILDVWESGLDGWPDQTLYMLMPEESKQYTDLFQTIRGKSA